VHHQDPITAESILEEDGADSALTEFNSEVKAAEEDIRALVWEDRERVWTIRELQDDAAAAGGRSSTEMSVAFIRMARRGELVADHGASTVIAGEKLREPKRLAELT
jgi:hypothetical protein